MSEAFLIKNCGVFRDQIGNAQRGLIAHISPCPESRAKAFGKPKKTSPPLRNHAQEFLMAAKGEIPYNAPLSKFAYGGKLTAFALMGNIAARVKGKLLYDAKKHQFTNSDEANKLMTRKPREGWYLS